MKKPQQTLHGLTTFALETHWRGNKDEERAASHCRAFLNGSEFYGGKSTPRANLPVSALGKVAAVHLFALRRDGLSDTSLNRRMSTLSVLVRIAIEQKWICADEAPVLKRKREGPPRERVLTANEATALSNRFDGMTSHLYEFLLNTGMRLGEALNLTTGDVVLGPERAQVAHVRDSKSGHPRTVPLNKFAANAVLAAYAEEEAMMSERVFPICARTFQERFANACRFCGLTDVVVHSLRHTCATNLVRAGVPLPVVGKILGHRKLETTMKYVHSNTEDMENAVRKLEAQ